MSTWTWSGDLEFGSGLRHTFGVGSPEGVVTAPIGSVYVRTDGTPGLTYYVKESGVGNTGWAAISSPNASLTPVIDIACFVPSTLVEAQVLLHYEARHSSQFPTNLAGSKCTAIIGATTSTVINILHNGVQVGTMTFDVGSSVATLVLTGFTAAVDDTLDFVAANADATLFGVAFTVVATRLS